MSIPTSPRRFAAWLAVLCAAAGAASGCAWQSYAVTRAIRYGTGEQTRVHAIVPLAGSLKGYRVVEVIPLENLLPGRIPPSTERYLDDQVVKALGALASSPQIVPVAQTALEPNGGHTPSAATLRVDGFIDDFDAGSLPLRIAELGFNHVAVTVRIRLRDTTSSQIVGAASFTTQDDRVTATTTTAINNIARRIGAFVNAGYAR